MNKYDFVFSCQYKNSDLHFKILNKNCSTVSVKDIKDCLECSAYSGNLASDIMHSRVYNTDSHLWYFGMIGKEVYLLGKGGAFITTIYRCKS